MKLLKLLRRKVLPSKRLWRTLIRVTAVDREVGLITVTVPAWDAHTPVMLLRELDGLPDDLWSWLTSKRYIPIRLYAEVNIGAENWWELIFEDWEFPKELI